MTSLAVRSVSRTDVLVQLRRLAAVYGLRGRDLEELAGEWYRVLGSLTSEALERAVTAYIAGEHRFWPAPGQIRKLARETAPVRGPEGLAGEMARWYAQGMGDGEPCPVCGSILACRGCGKRAGQSCSCYQRVEVRHDRQRHAEAGIGYAGPR
jgi:hypothetical protein